ncbi:MAG TPA: hypothetical protein DEP57_06530 [Selenomonas sp.]|nr:hypothetical protein [Selenomonas sp.]
MANQCNNKFADVKKYTTPYLAWAKSHANFSWFIQLNKYRKTSKPYHTMGFEVFLCCGEGTKAGDWLLGVAGRGWTTAGAGDDKNCGAIKEIRIFMANKKLR